MVLNPKRFRTFAINEFFFAGHLQSLGAAGLVFVALLYYINVDLTFLGFTALLVWIYAAFQTIYYYDRFTDLDIDKITNETRVVHISLYKRYLPFVISLLSFVLPTYLYLFVNKMSGLFIATLILFGFLYPILFKKLTRLIPIFKNFYVASVFGIIPFFSILYLELPLQTIPPNFYFFMFYIFLETLIMQIMLDMKDEEGDRKQRLKTLTVLIGKKRAIIVASLLILLTSSFFALHFINDKTFLLWFVILFVLIGNFTSLYFINRNKSWGYLLEAAKPIWWTLLFVAAKILS